MGEELLGKYRIVRKLGAGGMGQVFLAEDLRLGRMVAIKFPADAIQHDPHARERFLREARAAAALNHPHVAAIHEIGEADGKVFHVQELVDGETLRDRLKRGPVPALQALEWAAQLADAVAEAHRCGIVHRDIKPGNVMVTTRGDLKLLDFGLARELPGTRLGVDSQALTHDGARLLTAAGIFVGTIGYAAPETMCGEPADARSDVFSIGVVLYEMLAGRRPFEGDTPPSLAKAVLQADAPDLPEEVGRTLPGLNHLVRKALAREPAERHVSAVELLADLRGLVKTLDAKGKVPRTGRRRPVAAVTVAVVAIVAMATLWRIVLRKPPLTTPLHRQITFVGNAWLPALSVDGRWLAHVTGREWEPQTVWVRQVDAATPEEWFRARSISSLQWSPSRSELLLTGQAGDGTTGLFLLSKSGSTARNFPDEATIKACWSPDGARMAVVAGLRENEIAMVDRATGRLTSVPFESPFRRMIDVAWSPSGGWLAVLGEGEDGKRGIWTVAEDGSSKHLLLEEAARLETLRWTAHALEWLRYDESGVGELWELSVEPATGEASGAPARPLPGIPIHARYSASGDGKALAYDRAVESSNLWLFALAADAPSARRVTSGNAVKMPGRVSPDGGRVALVSVEGSKSSLLTLPLDGGASLVLLTREGRILAPAWSTDGKYIAFCAESDGGHRVFTINARGGPPRELVKTRLSIPPFVGWLPDGRLIYLPERARNLRITNPLTEEETNVLMEDAAGRLLVPEVSPAGDGVAVHWEQPSPDRTGLYTLSLADGSSQMVRQGAWRAIGWSEGGSGIHAMELGGARREVALLPIREGGLPGPTFRLANESPCLLPSLAPDRRHVLCMIEETVSDIWMAEISGP